jgi:UDP-N-acetylglucosamine 2-epimerase (non-hydrolysing)/GDP/UDP-N,N'-diacetylbacillosamine 2-epimerase (hydrolysing)
MKNGRAKRKICVVTGSRSEYGILRPVMRALAADRRFKLQVVAAGMHLSRAFGGTVSMLDADGLAPDALVRMTPADDSLASMAESVGKGITGFTRAFERLAPDVVVVLGDRTEAFAAAVAATLSGRVLAHIHGGDRAEAGYDDFMRHAITKLAHVHFAATGESARRILRLGERENRIFVVGAPGLDEIRTAKLPTGAETKKRLGFGEDEPLILCVQHSVSTHPETAEGEMEETLAALERLGAPAVVVYPNSDAGGRAMIKVIRRYERCYGGRGGWLRAYKSLPRDEFLAVMKAASVMVGNSSSGIIEAASFGLPVVNIGRRQAGRQRSGNTLDVGPDRREILFAAKRILTDRRLRGKLSRSSNVYGDGRAARRVVRVLGGIGLGPDARTKQITY